MRAQSLLRAAAVALLCVTSVFPAGANQGYADWLLSADYVPSDDFSARQDIFAAVEDSLWNNRFDKLEALAKKYREDKTRTPGGRWALSFFYEGVRRFRRGTTESVAADLEQKFQAWVQAYPNSPTPRIAYAAMLIEQAWQIRGTGTAMTVSRDAWRPFAETVKRARQVLLQSRSTAFEDPHWYAAMAEIATLQDWPADKYSALIDEALRREPYYDDIYIQAANRYLPKWGGNAQLLESFAREAIERTRAGEGSAIYARIYWAAFKSQFRDALFEDSRIDWAEMSKGMDDILAKYPDRWNLSHFAYFAFLAGDYAKTLQLMEQLEAKGTTIPAPWGGSIEYYSCKWWAELLGG